MENFGKWFVAIRSFRGRKNYKVASKNARDVLFNFKDLMERVEFVTAARIFVLW